MDRTAYLFMSACNVYEDLKEKNSLHLLDALYKDGYISILQYQSIKNLEEVLHDNTKMGSSAVSHKNNNRGLNDAVRSGYRR